jgi:hypothetical protein
MSTGRMISVSSEGEEVTRGVGVVVGNTSTQASNALYFPVPRDTFSVKFPWKINGPVLIEFSTGPGKHSIWAGEKRSEKPAAVLRMMRTCSVQQ